MTSKGDCYEISGEIYQHIFEGLYIISFVITFYMKLETSLSFCYWLCRIDYIYESIISEG